MSFLYRQNNTSHPLLDRPFIYRLSQDLLAPGAEQLVGNYIQCLLNHFSKEGRVLDIGCGPKSWLWQVGINPIGLDVSYSYCQAYHQKNEPIVQASSIALPFPDESFMGIWSIGMFHHLGDEMSRQAIKEMLRICRDGGYVAIFDAVLPVHWWRRPLAYAIRRADRGRFMRSQDAIEALLPLFPQWSISRKKYSLNGMEILVCWLRKST